MSNVSAVILAKNSEQLLADCIDSVSFCDEIIVIDDYSTDRTPDLAKHLGARVFSFKSDSFAERRNYALRKVKSKWVLYIDADERISTELKATIVTEVDKERNNFAGFRLSRQNYYFGKYPWPYIEKMERLFKKSALKGWEGKLHETPQVKGEFGDLEGFLLHYTHRDLTSMVEKTARWSQVEAELRLHANHPKMTWWRFFRVMVTGFYGSYIKQQGWRAGTAGLIESMFQAFSMFITYARLWELQNDFGDNNTKVQ